MAKWSTSKPSFNKAMLLRLLRKKIPNLIRVGSIKSSAGTLDTNSSASCARSYPTSRQNQVKILRVAIKNLRAKNNSKPKKLLLPLLPPKLKPKNPTRNLIRNLLKNLPNLVPKNPKSNPNMKMGIIPKFKKVSQNEFSSLFSTPRLSIFASVKQLLLA